MKFRVFLVLSMLTCTFPLAAHDTWVQTNTNIVRLEDAIYVDLMLGNHGNDHRDFKIASKTSLEPSTLEVIAPNGRRYDLKNDLVDRGYAPKEGYWSGRFVAAEAGLYTVAHAYDAVFHQTRGIKSAKTHFVMSPSLDLVSSDYTGFDQPQGHALELVAMTNPVAPMGPGLPINVRLLYHGKPLVDTRVSFVPRGVELSQDFDERYERMTDQTGWPALRPPMVTIIWSSLTTPSQTKQARITAARSIPPPLQSSFRKSARAANSFAWHRTAASYLCDAEAGSIPLIVRSALPLRSGTSRDAASDARPHCRS